VTGAKVDNVLNLFELNAIQLSTTDWSLSGTTSAEAGQTLEFILNSHSFTGIVTEVLDGPNVWTVTQSTNNDVEAVLSSLVHGNSYDMTVRVRDAAGNAAAPVTASLLVKLYPPDIPTIQLLQTNTYTPTITGTALKEKCQQRQQDLRSVREQRRADGDSCGSVIHIDAGSQLQF
jgi:large repetitive protein